VSDRAALISGEGPDAERFETAVRLAGKARFDDIYNQDDPRAYFRALRKLEYQTPAHGQPIFAALISELQERRQREQLVILDLCCSYGVNAALLNYDLTMPELYERYCSPEVASFSTSELLSADRTFYAGHRHPVAHKVIGVDIASRAVTYALRVGLLDGGSSDNLETTDPSAAFVSEIRDVDLITVTGGFSYIGERTLRRVLSAISGPRPGPWMAGFCIRWMDNQCVVAAAADHGLVSETWTARSFPQRRFADQGERRNALRQLRRLGIDPTAREAEGYLHVELLVARPSVDRRGRPLEAVLGYSLN
jgi:hypothetical protein